MLTLLLVVPWLVAGYLPTRVMKHYFIYLLGDEAWGRSDTALSLFYALLGPLGALPLLLVRWSLGSSRTPWGWKW